VPVYTVKVERDHVYVDLSSATKRKETATRPTPLSRPPVRHAEPIRLVGISTTVMTNSILAIAPPTLY